MKKRVSQISIENAQNNRWIDVQTGCVYYCMGRGTLMKLAEKAGAIRKVGTRVLLDRNLIDQTLDNADIKL